MLIASYLPSTALIIGSDVQTSIHNRLGQARNRLSRVAMSKRSIWQDHSLTSDCDVVIQFPKHSSSFLIDWLCNVLKNSACGIEYKMSKHEPTGRINILCSCTFQSLLRTAEEMTIKKRLKPEFGGQLRDFFLEDAYMYEGLSDADSFFTSQERQSMTFHLLNNIRLTESQKILGYFFVQGQAVVPRLVATQLIQQVYPIHLKKDLDELRCGWVFDFTAAQPLDAIKDYFGVHIGMYFAFLGYYTKSLFLPAVVGVAIWLYSGRSQDFDDVAFILFALLNVIWSTVYIELWKRREAERAYSWGTLDKQDDLITEPRPLYRGELRESPVTGRLEPYFPKWKRNLFYYSVSVPVMVICHFFIVLVCFNFFTLYDLINDKIQSGQLYVIFKPIPNIFLAIAVMVMDKVYNQIAVWLNDRENYRSDEEYNNQLIIKLMVFQSVNSFLSLFYTAFYIQDFNRLKNQLAVLFVVRQVVGNMKESLLSFFIAKVKQYQGASGSSGKELLTKLHEECKSVKDIGQQVLAGDNLGVDDEEQKDTHESTGTQMKCPPRMTQAEAEGLLPKYDGTFEDYLEMVIQFSYVTWFSSVFPLAGLFALLNNVVEIRSDAFKLCMSYQRPFGEQARDIGAWQTVLEVMSVGTIIVNTALIGISGPMQRIFPDLTNVQRLLLIVIMEHVVLAIKMIIRVAISNVPEWIGVETAKLEFSRREALRCRLQEHMFELNKPSPTCYDPQGLHHHSEHADCEAKLDSEGDTEPLPHGCDNKEESRAASNTNSPRRKDGNSTVETRLGNPVLLDDIEQTTTADVGNDILLAVIE